MLSVSCFDNDKIYNYKINKDPDTGKFFIFQDSTFDSIKELVKFYESASLKDDEVCLKTGVSCDLSYNIRPRDAWKISPEDLKMQYVGDNGCITHGRPTKGHILETIGINCSSPQETDNYTVTPHKSHA